MKKTFTLKPITVENVNKMTGLNVTHVIIKDGPIDKPINESSFQISYYSNTDHDQAMNKKRNKIKYTCSKCRNHAWGKPLLNIICGDCMNPYIVDNKEIES